MTTTNALAFFLMGALMFFVPAISPDCFAVRALDGSNTSALWLGVMGLFHGAMGIFYIARNEAVPFAIRIMAVRLPAFKPAHQALPALLLGPLGDRYMAAGSDEDQRLAA